MKTVKKINRKEFRDEFSGPYFWDAYKMFLDIWGKAYSKGYQDALTFALKVTSKPIK